MIRQQFYVEHYWEVIVFYDLDFDLFDIVEEELLNTGFPLREIDTIYYQLWSGYAKAVTCSNGWYHKSIILLPPHTSPQDYLDSIVHEAEHVKQAMLRAYRVEDRGEPPAYTIGYLVSQMYPVFRNIICDGCE
jgi:hypothetical protein